MSYAKQILIFATVVGFVLATLFLVGAEAGVSPLSSVITNVETTIKTDGPIEEHRSSEPERDTQLDSATRQDGGFYAQRQGYSRGRRRQSERSDYKNWEIEKEFKHDVFTFVRIQYDSFGGGYSGRTWANDFPDCDWNFSVRVHELTSMQVDPNGKVIRLTDEELFQHPFVFMTNVNRMALSDDEVSNLRTYLKKGGFLMADDFWAPRAWQHVEREMKRVFPDIKPRELPRDHEIFNIVYEVQGKLQVPSIRAWLQGDEFEYWHGDPLGDEDPHFWGYFDGNDRLMALMCHNNDIADGWEREGENKEYFKKYSERVSYPLGINIITYAMTH